MEQLLTALKLYLGIDPTDTTQDEKLTRALELALATLEKWLDRIIIRREISEEFPHHFGSVILHHLPVSPTVVVSLNGSEDTSYSWYKAVGGLAHLSRVNSRFDVPMDWRPYDQVVVTYTAGYDPIPDDLAYGVVLFAANLYESEGTSIPPATGSQDLRSLQLYDVGVMQMDVSSNSSPSNFYLQSGFIPNSVAEHLMSYRRMSV